MQRSKFPQASPPLHHPVPQHHVPIPVMQSPPLMSQASNSAGYNMQYAPQPAMGISMHPAYGDFFNDPTAQMAFQVGGKATEAAGAYMEQNLGRYLQISALKHYFNVSNGYVRDKLYLVLFPWKHKPWSRNGTQRVLGNGQVEMYFLPPRDDINSPDMYIPVMAFVTYILLSTLLYGLAGNFHPELLGYIASFSFAIVFMEIIIIKFGCYILNITNDSQLLDLVAYSGYKFVGSIVNIAASSLGSRVLEYAVFAYTFNANAFFLVF
ncbi:Protein transport protein yif1 [Rhizina undulata]